MPLQNKITSLLAQTLANQQAAKPVGRLKNAIVNRLINLLLRWDDPLVKVNIAGVKMNFPLSHKLPLYRRLFPYYSANLPRIARQVKTKYDDMVFVDVGANVGDTIALLRQLAYFPVLAIEGDDAFFAILQSNVASFSDVKILKTFLGDSEQLLEANVSRSHGSAHITQNGASATLAVRKLSGVLQDYLEYQKFKMLKIDTDGYDNKILRGAADYLASVRPVIFFEYDPFYSAKHGENALSIFSYLQSLGYSKVLFYDNYGYLLLSTDIDNASAEKELYFYFLASNATRYCDVCVFHSDDRGLFEQVYQSELEIAAQIGEDILQQNGLAMNSVQEAAR